ncbi:MAG: single-stranded DNA exonuclease RecJ [Synergistaceae bacterium]|nr:single-stranded DNA exonuclease RecJ [Synergistaceae bacterium]
MTARCSTCDLDLFTPAISTGRLAASLGCSLLTAAVLESRASGGTSAPDFPSPPEWDDALLDDLLLGGGAEEAAERWKNTPNLGRVLVYGDYDVDGVSSTTLALDLCKNKSTAAKFFIPHRHEEGYGLHSSLLKDLLSYGWDTLLIVDCGSKDRALLDMAIAQGLRVFVFDHHLPEDGQPLHHAVVNPHGEGGCENGRALCAAGVLWAWAWKYSILPRKKLEKMTDLVALATLADCMPLTSLNRMLVRRGMDMMSALPRPGLARLFSRLNLSAPSITEESLIMRVIPCLNAAGRMEFADTAVTVLQGSSRAEKGVEDLLTMNKRRQTLSGEISREALLMLENTEGYVALGEDWPVGVLSGVASRICSRNSTPVVLAAPVKEGIRGTVRVPEGGDAIKLLSGISSSLDAWGGHRYAAGFSVSRGKWKDVASFLEKEMASMEIAPPRLSAVEMDPADIGLNEWKELACLGPFGNGNPPPLFFTARKGKERLLPLGKDGRHLQIEKDGIRLLAFDGAADRNALNSSEGWLYRPRLDCWKGMERLQFVVDYVVV